MDHIFALQALSTLLGVLYLFGRYRYFHGYAQSATGRLAPLYFSAKVQWVLITLAGVGVLCSMSRLYMGLDPLSALGRALFLGQFK